MTSYHYVSECSRCDHRSTSPFYRLGAKHGGGCEGTMMPVEATTTIKINLDVPPAIIIEQTRRYVERIKFR